MSVTDRLRLIYLQLFENLSTICVKPQPSMRKTVSFILLLASLCLFIPTDSLAARAGKLSGGIFYDSNGNNVRNREETSGASGIIWLYRVLPNGAVQRVRQVYTDARGKYKIGNVTYGNYFLAVHYLTGGGTAIRTGNFRVSAAVVTRNVPVVTSATLVSNPLYAAAYTGVTNPDRLSQRPGGPTTPYAP
jgi:hypothetical protein